ncbi:hypothetical protein [Kocuria rosea]|uniref:hypothetical protein n=1 Tax=Kocuria rosea TaxID=1275 RepID=UPI000B2D65E0|nr:hypothetical protein [Kocuria polaris]
MRRKRTVLYGLVDQGIVSLTSLLVLASAAQSLNPGKLGLFSIGMASIVSCVAIVRSMTGETYLVRVTNFLGQKRDETLVRGESRFAFGLSICLGLGSSVAIAIVGLMWSEPRQVLFCSALAVVPIIAQDCMRHVCIARRRTTPLLGADFLVLFASVTGIYFVGLRGFGPDIMILTWGVAGTLGSLFVVVSERVRPSFAGAFNWLKAIWPSSSAFVVEASLGALVGYAIVVVLGTVSSPAEVAGYRATISVFGVTSLVINFLRTAILRELSPEGLSRWKYFWTTSALLAGLVLAVSTLTLILVLLVPDKWGYAAFGGTWSLVTQFAPWAAVNRMAAGLSVIPLIILRVQGVAWSATRIRLKLTVPLLLLAPVISSLAGAPGAFMVDTAYYLCITALLMRLALPERSGDK